jgi:DNA polymerase III alpha subunit
VDHLLGLRLRLVPEAAWHPWAEQPRELLLIAGDDEAWLALVALSNRAHLANADFRGPRVDWRDLEQHCRGELICLTGAPMVGVLSPLVENAADPSNPTEAVALTRCLAELFPHHCRESLPSAGPATCRGLRIGHSFRAAPCRHQPVRDASRDCPAR